MYTLSVLLQCKAVEYDHLLLEARFR